MSFPSPMRRRAFLLSLLLAWSCGGDRPSEDPASEATAQSGQGAEESSREGGVLSADRPVDPELASRGQELFKNRGCVACHTVGGGRLVGPDLQGVTDRRELTWIRSMILNPDSMLRADPTAKELLGQYYTPMTNMQVKPEEIPALIHFLRRESDAPPDSVGS